MSKPATHDGGQTVIHFDFELSSFDDSRDVPYSDFVIFRQGDNLLVVWQECDINDQTTMSIQDSNAAPGLSLRGALEYLDYVVGA
jgi:hypothetical protein